MHPKHKTRQEWLNIVEGQQQSGLSNKAYAEMTGVSLSSFLAWKHRIKTAPSEQNSSFVEVSFPRITVSLILRFPNGIELQIPNSVGTTQIQAILNWAMKQ